MACSAFAAPERLRSVQSSSLSLLLGEGEWPKDAKNGLVAPGAVLRNVESRTPIKRTVSFGTSARTETSGCAAQEDDTEFD